MHRALIRFGNLLFSARNHVFPLVFLAIAAMSFRSVPLGSERVDLALDVIGLGVAVAGQTLRAMVIGLAYIRRGGKEKKDAADVSGFFHAPTGPRPQSRDPDRVSRRPA